MTSEEYWLLFKSIWLAGGILNWFATTSSRNNPAPVWSWFVMGIPICLILGPIPLVPMLLGIPHPEDRRNK